MFRVGHHWGHCMAARRICPTPEKIYSWQGRQMSNCPTLSNSRWVVVSVGCAFVPVITVRLFFLVGDECICSCTVSESCASYFIFFFKATNQRLPQTIVCTLHTRRASLTTVPFVWPDSRASGHFVWNADPCRWRSQLDCNDQKFDVVFKTTNLAIGSDTSKFGILK